MRNSSDYNHDRQKENRKRRTYSISPERNTRPEARSRNYENTSVRKVGRQRRSHSRSESPRRKSPRRKSRSPSPKKRHREDPIFQNHSKERRYRTADIEERHDDKRQRSRTPSPSPRKHSSRPYATKSSQASESRASRFVLVSYIVQCTTMQISCTMCGGEGAGSGGSSWIINGELLE